MTVQLSAVGSKVWLFRLKTEGVRGRLSLNVIRQICSFLRSFDRQTSTWSEVPLRARVQVDSGSRWIVLEDGSVFCSGGGKD